MFQSFRIYFLQWIFLAKNQHVNDFLWIWRVSNPLFPPKYFKGCFRTNIYIKSQTSSLCFDGKRTSHQQRKLVSEWHEHIAGLQPDTAYVMTWGQDYHNQLKFRIRQPCSKKPCHKGEDDKLELQYGTKAEMCRHLIRSALVSLCLYYKC